MSSLDYNPDFIEEPSGSSLDTTLREINVNIIRVLEAYVNGFPVATQPQIDLIQAELTTINNEITTINNELTTINNEITTINNELTTINNEITAINGEITTINGEITTINGEITTINGEITTINNEITTINGEINNLDNRVTQTETDITTLEDIFPATTVVGSVSLWADITGSSLTSSPVIGDFNLGTFTFPSTGGIILPANGGTPRNLNCYEDYFAAIASTIPASFINVSLYIIKLGLMVNVVIGAKTANIAPATSTVTFTGVVPARFCPVVDVGQACVFSVNGVDDTGLIGTTAITTSGDIIMYRDTDGAPDVFTGVSGWVNALCFTYYCVN